MAEDWSNNATSENSTTTNSGDNPPPAPPPPSTANISNSSPPPTLSNKCKTPEQSVQDLSKTEQDEKTPRIRLKANLATDPALQTSTATIVANLKSESIESCQSPSEYLANLAPALQTVLASRGFFIPPTLSLDGGRSTNSSTTVTEEPRAPSVPIYQCSPCGIRFSSLSTLEAHQTYYCSHRTNKQTTDDDAKSTTGGDASGTQSDQDPSEPSAKNIRTGKPYTCTHCSYSADKKVSLNRHMRMHTVSPSPANTPITPATIPINGDNISNPDTNHDRYCAECDIRFSSQKTYRAHKAHYCNSRHMIKSTTSNPKTASSCTSGSSPTSPTDTSNCRTPPSPGGQLPPPQQPFLALPTNPIIIVPYSLFRSASVLPGLSPAAGIPTPDTPCFLLPNGTLQPMTTAITTTTTPPTAAAATTNPPPVDVLKSANNKQMKESQQIRDISSAPLDLSVRKSPELKELIIDLGDEHEKENVRRRSPTPEKIECVPSLHGSPPPLTPSPKRKHDETSRSSSPRLSRSTPKSTPSLEKSRTSPETSAPIPQFDIPAQLHPLLMRAGTIPFPIVPEMRLTDLPPQIPPVIPQVLVKQGVSKCKECNIVFCKHENYVIHKKHYCSARNNQDDDNSKTSTSPPISPRSTDTTSPAGVGHQYQQLICLACGIKFTSLDNLNAHQAYYCLKRNELDRKCGKCRSILEPGHQCNVVTNTTAGGVAASALAGWKCPCCDIISPTASAAQRHMESHTGVKAYRCIVCRYKGNTLRGMRTHIRMHFKNRSPDFQVKKKKQILRFRFSGI